MAYRFCMRSALRGTSISFSISNHLKFNTLQAPVIFSPVEEGPNVALRHSQIFGIRNTITSYYSIVHHQRISALQSSLSTSLQFLIKESSVTWKADSFLSATEYEISGRLRICCVFRPSRGSKCSSRVIHWITLSPHPFNLQHNALIHSPLPHPLLLQQSMC